MVLGAVGSAAECVECGSALGEDVLCRYCGARVRVAGVAVPQPVPGLLCARCINVPMALAALAGASLHECERCTGMWVDIATWERLLVDPDRQAALQATLTPPDRPPKSPLMATNCPACGAVMERLSIAAPAARAATAAVPVIIDRCGGHGVWLDGDELRQVVRVLARWRPPAPARAKALDDPLLRELLKRIGGRPSRRK